MRRPTGRNSRGSGSAISRASISPVRRSGRTACPSTSPSRWPSPPRRPGARPGFFVCQQHYPENFWSRSAQDHPNDALGLAAVRFSHPRPSEGREFLSLFLDAPAEEQADGYGFALDDTRLTVTRDAAGEGARMTGLVFRVADLPTCRRALQAGGVAYEQRAGALVVPSEAAMGATLSFSEG